jgi:nitrate/TMAO reductase-like tetraheme cytochrome c subunit
VKRMISIFVIATVAIAFGSAAWAQEGKKEEKLPLKPDTLKWAEEHFSYIGDKNCKMCHKVEFESWEKTAHAKAWETLSAEEQKDENCIGCHSIGKDAKGELLTGVGCEACHGPGSEYKKMSIMKDHDASVAAGLMNPDEQWCRRCHNPNNPNHKPFNFEEAMKAGIHEVKKAESK